MPNSDKKFKPKDQGILQNNDQLEDMTNIHRMSWSLDAIYHVKIG